MAKQKTANADYAASNILFDSKMRKTLVEGVIQDIKGILESMSNGLVSATYEDYCLEGHEFGFKLRVARGEGCRRQMFSEAVSTAVNAVNYMFQGDASQYDVTVFTEDGLLEVEIVSNW